MLRIFYFWPEWNYFVCKTGCVPRYLVFSEQRGHAFIFPEESQPKILSYLIINTRRVLYSNYVRNDNLHGTRARFFSDGAESYANYLVMSAVTKTMFLAHIVNSYLANNTVAILGKILQQYQYQVFVQEVS